MFNVKSTTMVRQWFLIFLAAFAITGCSSAQKTLNNNNTTTPQVTPGTPQDFLLKAGDRVFFTTNSSDLTLEARGTLDKQAQWLTQYPRYQFIVEGHADERGTREYNLALSARRANATMNYLASRGISRSRMRIVAFGKERPVAVCNDISCWSQNRRAVTVLNGQQGS